MGFALLIVGLLMVITGARGTYAQFGRQIASEFQGQNNFTYWLLAIGTIGALGYIQSLQVISRWLMALILLSIFLSHKGFFAQFQAALKAGPVAPQPATSAPANSTGSPLLDLGPLGTIDPKVVPGGTTDNVLKWFGFGSTSQ